MPSTRDIYKKRAEAEAVLRPLKGRISSVVAENEEVKVQFYGTPGAQPIPVRHPYLGVNAWLRFMPEVDTEVFVQRASQPEEPQIFGYISKSRAQVHKKKRDGDTNILFKQLRPGEAELLSAGRAYTNWDVQGNLRMIGGVSEFILSRADLEISSRTPAYHRKLHHYANPAQLGHEEKFGVVKRSTDLLKPFTVKEYKKVNGKFAMEYGRWLNDADGNQLSYVHEGHLFDEKGEQLKNIDTNKNLRYRRGLVDNSLGELNVEVDEDLNIFLSNTGTGAKKVEFDFGALAEAKVVSKKITGLFLESGDLTFGSNFVIKARTTTITAGTIGLAGNVILGGNATTGAAAQPVVLGKTFETSVVRPLVGSVTAALNALVADPAISAATKAVLSSCVAALGVLPNAAAASVSTAVKAI